MRFHETSHFVQVKSTRIPQPDMPRTHGTTTHIDNARRVVTGMRVGSIYHFGKKTIFHSLMEKAYLCRAARSRCKRPFKCDAKTKRGEEDIGLACQICCRRLQAGNIYPAPFA